MKAGYAERVLVIFGAVLLHSSKLSSESLRVQYDLRLSGG